MGDSEQTPDDKAGTALGDGDAVSAQAGAQVPASTPAASVHTPQELSRAMQAFKKRLKLTQLDSESKLGYGPMTGGRPSGIVAITPPNQFPRSVWDALVAEGRLRKGGQGQYEMVK